MVTADELDALRPRLRAFCYQMLGSPFDAEDAVQDALERAWRARDRYDETRASLTTWCFAIARNVCLDRLRESGRRPLPRDLQEPGIEIGAPLVAATDVPWLMPAPAGWARGSVVEEGAERSDEVRFAVTALLQALPAVQRAVFTLREVLRFSAADTAAVLETSVPAVNSALQRARAGLGDAGGRASGADDESRVGSAGDEVVGRPVDRERVERYAAALERGDVPALVEMVAADVVLEMPPAPAWSQGAEQYRDFMAYLFEWRGTDWSTRVVVTDEQSVLLLYRVEDGVARPHTVQLLGADADGRIDHVLVYPDPRLFALFERASDEFRGARA